MKKDCLFSICQDVFAHYQKAKKQLNDKIIGVPILFFGDVDKYFSQRIKILTVGQNPSKDEFPEGFERFENFSYFVCFNTAVECNPNYALAYYNLGRCFALKGEKIEAAKYFQQAMDVNNITNEIDPSDIQDRLNSLFD